MKLAGIKIEVFFEYQMISGDHTPLIPPKSKNIHGAVLGTTHSGLSSENLGVTSLKKGSSTSSSSSIPDFHVKGLRIGGTVDHTYTHY